MNYSKCIRIVVLWMVVIGLCTSCSVASRIKRADKRYAIGEYYQAGEMYRQLYRRVPSKDKATRGKVAFYQGECYHILNNPTRAIAAYKNAIRNHYPDSIMYLHYAQVLQYQGQYGEAAKQYAIYLEAHPDDYVALAGKYACAQVPEWKKEHYRYVVKAVNDFNQKRTSNFSPCYIGVDADAVVFTSNRSTQDASAKKKIRTSPVTGVAMCNLFTTRKNAAGKWEEIEVVNGLYGSDEGSQEGEEGKSAASTGPAELGVACTTEDGKTMYFTFTKAMAGQDLGAKIYTSSRASGEWGEAQEVKLFSDSSITVAHPALSSSGDTLYFVSDAPGGYGGKDIWMATQDGGQWGDIVNLGPKINTSDDELFPFIRPDGRLYFASKGHPGYGGLDLFYADRVDTTWVVFNMGAPFNSNGDDFGICFAGRSENGLFSSNRGQKKGYDLIYSFTLPAMEFYVEGRVEDNNGEGISDAYLRLVGDNGTNVRTQIRRDGTYKLKLEKDVKYLMLATARGYLNQKQMWATTDLNDSKTYTINFTLAPVSKPVKMGNIFFEFGKWELSPESEDGIEALVKLLNDNPNITIEMAAHTDLVGNDKDNKILSEKRAQSVVNRLIQSGIEPERLTPVGYGEEKPVVVDAILHKQYAFLPKDQVLNEEFILTLSKEQQEICNALNRRIEFRVLKTTYKLY